MSHQNRDHLPEMARTGLASHFLHCWANQLWATETLPSPLCLSCALEHDGVLVLQDCEASQSQACRGDQLLRVATDLDIHLASAGRRDTLSFLREPTSPDVFPVFSTFISGREKWDVWPNRYTTQMLIRQPGRMPREGSRTGPVGCPP